MLFNSVDFLIFFPIVVLLYFLIPKKIKYIWLLVASYYFYMCWNRRYALLILLSTIITYLAGLFIEKIPGIGKKFVLFGSIAINLGILVFFKYFDFLLDIMNSVLELMNIQTVSNPFRLLLPVGISFYTFQALGYVLDVYRGNIPAEKNPLKYALFVSFFPQLVAGPIERSGNLLKQIQDMGNKRLWDYEGIVAGFGLMLWGLFQKMVIADRCSIFVDSVYNNLYVCGTVETVLGAIVFAIQIYCDFAGYSAIAIGAARIMGFHLMENFNAPYFATSISDFWRRWHISLSGWFRDYLYIPMGGSRCSRIKKYRNIMVTFLVSGLWHGASFTYVIWGGIHGLYQIIGDLLKPVKNKLNQLMHVNTEVFSYHFGQVLFTGICTTFAWIFFRASTLKEALYYIQRMLTRWNPWVLFQDDIYRFGLDQKEMGILFVAVLVLFIADLLCNQKKCNVGEFLQKQNLWFRWIVFALLIVSILVYGQYGIHFDSTQFIYFTF